MDKCGCCNIHILPGEYCPRGCDRPIRGQCEECGYCVNHCPDYCEASKIRKYGRQL